MDKSNEISDIILHDRICTVYAVRASIKSSSIRNTKGFFFRGANFRIVIMYE